LFVPQTKAPATGRGFEEHLQLPSGSGSADRPDLLATALTGLPILVARLLLAAALPIECRVEVSGIRERS
jgi:hypothetical protein